NPNATILQADIRDPLAILDDPETRRLLDFDRPIGLLVVGVLLFIADADDPAGMIATYRDRLAPGSLLAISTLTDEPADDDLKAEVARLRAAYAAAGEHVHVRDRAAILPWFNGMRLVEPGLTLLPDWHPDEGDDRASTAYPLGYGGVARIG
ncbi:MAG TPA: SAM-dependent methyltransferase, partial [Pseudonocardiaceae bacterium]|nr:SAM-dependent methyltransferase [Pseudonocardiaceae bacterium]